MQQSDAIVVDNDNSLVVCDDGSKETIVATQNAVDSNAHEIITNDTDSISITKNDSIDDSNVCYSPSWSFHGDEIDDRSTRCDERDFECDADISHPQLPTSLKFNRNTMSIFVKRAANTPGERFTKHQTIITEQCNDFIKDSEDIICSPNFNSSEPTTNGNEHFERFRAQHSKENNSKIYHDDDDDVDDDMIDDDDELKAKEKRNDRVIELLQYKDPLRSAVVLRSPRGNQPRAYTTDALYSALMDVKSGESIYR